MYRFSAIIFRCRTSRHLTMNNLFCVAFLPRCFNPIWYTDNSTRSLLKATGFLVVSKKHTLLTRLFIAISFYVLHNIYDIVTALWIYYARHPLTHLQLNSVTLGLRLMSYVQQHQFLIYVPFRWIDIFT